MLVASTSVLASTTLLLPLALRERRHRGLARRRVAVRPRARYAAGGGGAGFGGLGGGGFGFGGSMGQVIPGYGRCGRRRETRLSYTHWACSGAAVIFMMCPMTVQPAGRRSLFTIDDPAAVNALPPRRRPETRQSLGTEREPDRNTSLLHLPLPFS